LAVYGPPRRGPALAFLHRMRRLPVILPLLIGALALTGVATDARAPQGIRLFDLTTAHGIVDEKPFRPARVFAPDDDVVYVWYRADGCTVGTTIRSIWFYLETDPPLQFSEGSVTVDRPDRWGQFNFRLAPGRQWRVGRYRIELRIGDAVMAETDFRIAAVQTAGIPAASISEQTRVATWRRPTRSSGR
jgi:hypothetical protein